MEIMINKLQLMFSVLGGIILSALGGYDVWLRVLVGFVVLDYVSGVAVGVKSGKVSSKTGFNGIIKKIFIFSVVYMANLVDVATGAETFRNVAVLFYVANEGISILENLGHLGVKYPQKFVDLFEQLKDGEKDDNKNEGK